MHKKHNLDSKQTILRRNDMFELSNRLVGIYKTMNATKVRLETQKIT